MLAPVLPVGEVVVAEVGPAEDDRVVEHKDLGVLQPQRLVVPLRYRGFPGAAQQGSVVQRNAARVLPEGKFDGELEGSEWGRALDSTGWPIILC